MPLDGLSLLASVCEMKRRGLIGAKIEKIAQPERDELILYTHGEGGKLMVLINASAEYSRAQLTDEKRVNPIDAPMFCMLLRKRLAGGRIVSIEQPDSDRVIILGIQARNELGDEVVYKLVAELMGRYSNIILVNEKGFVVDSIRHVAADMSSVRIVLPGAEYVMPPKQQKSDPLHATRDDYINTLSAQGRPDKLISSGFYSLAPNMAAALIETVTDKRESLTQSEKENIADAFVKLYQTISEGSFTVALAQNDYGEPIAIYPFEPVNRRYIVMPSVGEALDKLYKDRDIRMRIERKSASVKRILQNNIERCEKKLRIYIDAMEIGEDIEKLRIYGELITANLYALKTGSESAALINYYSEQQEIVSVPLDPKYSPSGNAQRYFKKYQKAKLAREMAKKQFDDVKAELDYLEGQISNLGNCTLDEELDELMDELRREGYIKADKGAKKQKPPKHAPSKPMHYISSTGASIYVGKNNQQNDMLTLKMADSEDMWLHTKNIPGSHCIIKTLLGDTPDKQTLFEAATLAAYYSKARGGENVAVDYTPRKYVKKPSGARPGMVIYTTNKTAYVAPDEALVKSLKLN